MRKWRNAEIAVVLDSGVLVMLELQPVMDFDHYPHQRQALQMLPQSFWMMDQGIICWVN